MQIQLSTKRLVRTAVFVAVFLAVMSVTFLLQAHDGPATPNVLASEPTPVASMYDPEPVEIEMDDVADGLASWYGGQFHGRRTASGARYDMNAFTAAHRSLPFGTLLRVENPNTGKSILVEVTDRGPFIRRRVLDLSYAAARQLGVSVTPVVVDALSLTTVEEFYRENDSTVLAFDADLRPVALLASSVRELEEPGTLTSIMRVRSDSDLVVVRPNGNKGTMFYRATMAN